MQYPPLEAAQYFRSVILQTHYRGNGTGNDGMSGFLLDIYTEPSNDDSNPLDQVGYWLREPPTGTVIHTLAMPPG